MFNEDEYECFSEIREHSDEVSVIDQINFSRHLYMDPLPLSAVIDLFPHEPGYGTSSGEIELSRIVKNLEIQRANTYAIEIGIPLPSDSWSSIEDSTVAVGSGVTGSLTLAIGGISLYGSKSHGKSRRIYYSTPGYSMIEEIAEIFALEAVPYLGSKESHLPDLAQLVESFDPQALAYVLTFPSNPTQECYTCRDLQSLKDLIVKCNETETFLVVDTIFQDMLWSGEPVPEVFAIAETTEFLVKVFGPSKDRPFACGLRVGYLIGDKRLRPHIDRLSSVFLNSHNFYSKLWLGIDLMLRAGSPTEDTFTAFEGNFILGNHGRSIAKGDMLERLNDSRIAEAYVSANEFNATLMKEQLDAIYDYVLKSETLRIRRRARFGNTLLVELKTPAVFHNEFDFFCEALFTKNVGLLVGGFFGVPKDWSPISFRVVAASESTDWMIEKLQRIEELSESRAR